MSAWRAAGLASLALLALAAWSAGEDARRGPNLATCLAAGPAAADSTIRIFREARVIGIERGAIQVRELAWDATARVTGITEPVEPGTPIGLIGRFTPPDRVETLAYHLHRGRFAKVWVSLPPLFWLLVTLRRTWRLGPRGFEER